MTTHYEVLGVGRNATREELKQAYRTKVSKIHTDRPRQQGKQAEHVELTVAYNILKNENSRKHYEAELELNGLFCEVCNGNGRVRKQKGFTGVSYVSCKPCKGTGICIKE